MLSTPLSKLSKNDPRFASYINAFSQSQQRIIQGYTPEHGYTYTGEVQGGEFSATPLECAKVCNSRKDCIGFNYNWEWGTCSLSTSRVERIRTGPVNTYFRKNNSLDKNELIHPNLGYISHSPSGIAFT